MTDKVKQGKKNRISGRTFELKVRKDLESKGWTISKWMNQVELEELPDDDGIPFKIGKLIPAKHKFCGIGRPMAIGTGFPDFLAFRKYICSICFSHGFRECSYNVIGVECKSNGYLTKEEKEKCEWLLENKVFSQILIASKTEKRGEIKYKEFKNEIR